MAKKERLVKSEVYAAYGIEYKAGKIYHPVLGWINPLLVDGNTKLGKGVWTWSMLPTNSSYSMTINGELVTIYGTCPCRCVGCYATVGNYRFNSVIYSLFIKTWLARHDIDFVKRAILAQIQADSIKLLRIHAAGDFFSVEYIAMWCDIVKATPETMYWTYTKNPAAENAFNDFSNANIVKSIIPGYGFNFGHVDYIMNVYKALKEMGKSVYICRCGIDPNQHCTNCHGCADHEYVLFVEHSTGYKATEDPNYGELVKLIESQAD